MSNTDRHPECHMRTALGNCDPIGGFCTSVNKAICEALHKAAETETSLPNGEQTHALRTDTHAMRSDTISRQDAIDALERIFDRCEEIEAHLPEGDPDRVGYKMYPDWLKVWNYLRQLPSAQPEIIRCKDCKYYIDNRCYKIKALDDLRGSNDFCSYAKRRADE